MKGFKGLLRAGTPSLPLLLLLAPVPSRASGAGEEVRRLCGSSKTPGALRDAACLIVRAEEDLDRLRGDAAKALEAAGSSLAKVLLLKPSGAGHRWTDFDQYFQRLRAAREAFLSPKNQAGLRKARGDWGWSYQALREAFVQEPANLEGLLAGLEKARGALKGPRERLKAAADRLAALKPPLPEGVEAAHGERSRLEKALKEFEDRLHGGLLPELARAARAMRRFLFTYDSEHISAEEKLSDGHYQDSDPTKAKLAGKVEAVETKRIREGKDACYLEVEKARDALEDPTAPWRGRR